MAETKNLLVIDPALTIDPGKSFPALILKYLSRQGWNPTLLTIPRGGAGAGAADWCGVRIINVPSAQGYHASVVRWLYRQRRGFVERRNVLLAQSKKLDPRASLYAAGDLGLLPLVALVSPRGERGLATAALWEQALALHHRQPFDAVLSIYGTFLSHQLARRFKQQTGAPWVALTKDYYSGMPFTWGRVNQAPLGLQQLRNALKRRQEGKTLNDSSTVVAYCDPLADYLRAFVTRPPIKVIPNCYDEEDYLEPLPAAGKRDEFVISCVGLISYHDLNPFFQALQELSPEWPGLKARFVGAEEAVINSYARIYNCRENLQVLPPLPHRDAVREMRQATCLLFPQIPFELPRRTPEYMAARRPILAMPDCPTAASQPIIQQYGATAIASGKEEIKAVLRRWRQEFQTTGQLSAPVNEEFVQSFSARHRAEQLGEALAEAVSSAQPDLARASAFAG